MWKIIVFQISRALEAARASAGWQRLGQCLRRRDDRSGFRTIVIARADTVDRPPALHWTPCHPTTRARFKASMACHNGHVLTLRGHRITPDGGVAPSVVCPTRGCAFHAYVRLGNWTFGAVQ